MKNLLRYVWRRFGFKKAWQSIKFKKLLCQWEEAKKNLPERITTKETTILIIPSDPLLLTASRGDDAMLTAVITHCRSQWPNANFVVATTGDEADKQAQKIGATPCRVFGANLTYKEITKKLCAHNISHCITIGADVMDGSYDPLFSAQLLITTDLIAQTGVLCAITGFSFSKTPSPWLKAIYNNFAPNVTFNLRDPVSFERFQNFTHANSTLVADVAFLLKPDLDNSTVQKTKDWISKQKEAGRTTLGINIHPLVLELTERNKIQEVVTHFGSILSDLIKEKSISLVFIEHDFRGSSADTLCLTPLKEILGIEASSYIYWPDAKMSAAELKATCSLLDGVISGRMHLMIGSVGVETPVFGINYKNKMEGLLKHCELSTSYLCTAKELLLNKEECHQKISTFIDDLPNIKKKLHEKLPKIKAMSAENLKQIR